MKPEYPSSFESEFGSVEYKVHVAFELENEPDQTIESPFKVIKFSNLNTYASLRVNICFIVLQTYLRYKSLIRYQKLFVVYLINL